MLRGFTFRGSKTLEVFGDVDQQTTFPTRETSTHPCVSSDKTRAARRISASERNGFCHQSESSWSLGFTRKGRAEIAAANGNHRNQQVFTPSDARGELSGA